MDGSERSTRGREDRAGKGGRHRSASSHAGPVAGRVEAAALFCSTCAAVQPPGQADHFARLGLSPRLRGGPGAARPALLRATAAAASRPVRDAHAARARALAAASDGAQRSLRDIEGPAAPGGLHPASASPRRQSRRLQPGERPGAADGSARDARGARQTSSAAGDHRLRGARGAATSRPASAIWPMRSPPTISRPPRGWRPDSSTCASSPTTAAPAG